MTQIQLKTTSALRAGDVVRHPFTDERVVVKEVREITYLNDRYDVFFERGSASLHVHSDTLWGS